MLCHSITHEVRGCKPSGRNGGLRLKSGPSSVSFKQCQIFKVDLNLSSLCCNAPCHRTSPLNHLLKHHCCIDLSSLVFQSPEFFVHRCFFSFQSGMSSSHQMDPINFFAQFFTIPSICCKKIQARFV